MWGFDRDEVIQIVISMLVVAVAFSMGDLLAGNFASAFPLVLVGVGTGFVFHELAHKFVAMHYGALARFEAWESGLVLALVLAFASGGAFTFAAPGAVYIYSPGLGKKANGIISAAGAATNLVVGLLFVALWFAIPDAGLAGIAIYAAMINFFLGAFNMLPVPPLDGSKVFAWNAGVWAFLQVMLGVLAFLLPNIIMAILGL
jgi:Zn-dependent protease